MDNRKCIYIHVKVRSNLTRETLISRGASALFDEVCGPQANVDVLRRFHGEVSDVRAGIIKISTQENSFNVVQTVIWYHKCNI